MHWVRRLAPWAVLCGLAWLVYQGSNRVGWLAFLGIVVIGLAIRWLMPRLAHRAFVRGQFHRSAFLYRLLGNVRLDREARAAARLSVVACRIGRDPKRALEELEKFDGEGSLGVARAALWNNRAYALARLERDLDRALELSCRALDARPDLPGFLHTRGVVLLALGRAGEALMDFDAAWTHQASAASSSEFEAERSFDVGRAWSDQGEAERAQQYWRRAWQCSPKSQWAMLAQHRLLETRSTPG